MKPVREARTQAEYYGEYEGGDLVEEVPTAEVTRKTLREALAHAFAREENARMPGAKHWRRADLALNTLAVFA